MAVASGSEVAFTFQKHIEDTRNLIQCKICLRPLYEPYTIACGHTYCYSCLDSWFNGHGDRKRNKNCPDCRATVRLLPAPNFLVRDLTHAIVFQAQLLPEDETVEEHQAAGVEEANLIAKHRQEEGLFHGVFSRPALGFDFDFRRIIHDQEDGVERCPYCSWEIEDGACAGCGRPYPGQDDGMFNFTSDDTMSSDMDDSSIMSASDEPSNDRREHAAPRPQNVFAVNIPPLHPPHSAPRRFYAPSFTDDSESVDTASALDDTAFDEDRYDTEDDFIDNEIEDDVDDLDEVEDEDEDDEDNVGVSGHGRDRFDVYSRDVTPYFSDNSEPALTTPVQAMSFPNLQSRRRHPRHPIVMTSEDENEDEDEDEDEDADNQESGDTNHTYPAELQDDEDDVVVRSRPTRQVPRNRRRRPVVVDDEDDEDEEEDEDGEGVSGPSYGDSDQDEETGEGVGAHEEVAAANRDLAAVFSEGGADSDDEPLAWTARYSAPGASSAQADQVHGSIRSSSEENWTEDTDDTALPPRQSNAARRRRREQQRKARIDTEQTRPFVMQTAPTHLSRRHEGYGRRRRGQTAAH